MRLQGFGFAEVLDVSRSQWIECHVGKCLAHEAGVDVKVEEEVTYT